MQIREYKGTEEFLLARQEEFHHVWIFDVFKYNELQQHIRDGWRIVRHG